MTTMALFEVKPIENEFVSVDYLGGTLDVPAHHQWVAMTKLDCANGEVKGLLVSYEVEPTVSRNGYYVAVPGTDSRILQEVEYQDPRGSLRRVQGHSQEEVILLNAEELALKIERILASDIEDKIHALFCPDHGVFIDFLKHTAPALAEHFDEVEAQNETENQAEDSPEGEPSVSIKVMTPNGAVSLEEAGLPAEVLEVLGQITSALKS